MGGRGSGSNMRSTGGGGSMPTNAQIDRMGFKSSVNSYTGTKQYDLNIDGVGGVTITENYDHSYTAYDDNGRPVGGGHFNSLNAAKNASKQHLKNKKGLSQASRDTIRGIEQGARQRQRRSETNRRAVRRGMGL